MNNGRFKKGNRPCNARDWTEIDRSIRDRYPSEGSEIASDIGLTKNAIHIRASKIGVKCNRPQMSTPGSREKISLALSGRIKPQSVRQKLAAALKGRSHSPDRIAAIITGVKNSRSRPRNMTKPEKMTLEILNSEFGIYNPFSYTGDRKLWLELGPGKFKNPDFSSEKNQWVIEVFGRYWHKPDEEEELVIAYRDAGWKCLVIWEDQIADARDDILFTFYPYEFHAEMMEDFVCT